MIGRRTAISPSACSLCDHLEYVIHSGRSWRTALNLNQNLLGRLVVVLRRHCEDITVLETEEWTDLHVELRLVRETLDFLFRPDHYNYSFWMNQDRHVHIHVHPRYRASRRWGDLDFDDPDFGSPLASAPRRLGDQQLHALARALASKITKTI